MSDPFDRAISESISRSISGAEFELVVGDDGLTTYAVPEPTLPGFAGVEDQTDPFAIAGPVEPMTPGEFGEKTAGVAAGAAGGTLATAIGTFGDFLGLAKGVTDMVGAEEGKRFEAFLQGLSDVSSVIGSERTIKMLEEGVQALPISDEAKQDILAGSKFIGETAGLPVGGSAALTGARRYIAGAPERVAERGTGMTLQSGVDPMAAVDEAIVGLKSKAAKAPTDEEEGFIAFSGSPSDFNQFSLSKIGTGEGNQQFGYGLYFSDIEDIARFYRDALSDRQPISLDDLDTDAPAIIANINLSPSDQPNMGFLKEADPDFDEYMQMIEDSAVGKTSSPLTGGFTDYEMKDGSVIRVSEGPDDALQVTDPRVVIQALGEPTGKVYKVKINAIKNELVDQTKPLGKQPKKVKDALNDIGDNLTLDDALNLGFDPFELGEQQALQQAREMLLDPESDVLSFLSNMQSIRGSVNAGEKALSDRGVKGMRYLTGAARQRRPIKAEQNYVIFDDKIIDILEKYGIVGPVAVSSVVASQGDQEQGEAQ